MKRRLCFYIMLLPIPLYCQVAFSGLDLSYSNQLLFQAGIDGIPKTLFVSQLPDSNIQQLTAVAQNMTLVENGSALYVQNMFSTTRIPLSAGMPQNISAFPSFDKDSNVITGRLLDIAASYDGQWVLFLEPTGYAFCKLLLLDLRSGEKIIIADNVEQYDRYFPARWSPDSYQFIYSKGGKLYYYSVGGMASQPIDEKYRLIGEGAVNSVRWGNDGDFFYLAGSVLYKVQSNVLFARELYTDFLAIGDAVSSVPFDFDPEFDAFWIAPDYSSIVLSKKGGAIFYYPLVSSDSVLSFPYLKAPSSCVEVTVLWADSGPSVIASLLNRNDLMLSVYSLNSDGVFVHRGLLHGSYAALSPDGEQVLIWGERGAWLYDYRSWTVLETISTNKVFSALWTKSGECVVGGQYGIELLQQLGSSIKRNVLCLSSVENYGFEEEGKRILAQSNGTWFSTDRSGPWTVVGNVELKAASLSSKEYRVFLEEQSSSRYLNVPMVRAFDSLTTGPLISVPRYTSINRADDKDDSPLITHGARLGNMDLALCFDLYDDVSGLSLALDALRRFGWSATFFLNGEFIRRNSTFVDYIVNAGHESASLFFAPIDLSSPLYRITEEFITKCISLNEDEFYNVTGKELSMLWHAPYYVYSQQIKEASSRLGYVTIGYDIDPEREESVSAMIDYIISSMRPGSIIPVRLGEVSGKSDYLFNRINVLFDAIKKAGYRVIPISAMLAPAP